MPIYLDPKPRPIRRIPSAAPPVKMPRPWRKKATRTAALLLETYPAGGKTQISTAGKSG